MNVRYARRKAAYAEYLYWLDRKDMESRSGLLQGLGGMQELLCPRFFRTLSRVPHVDTKQQGGVVSMGNLSNEERHRPCRTCGSPHSLGETIATDKHYTPAGLGKDWHVSPNTIRRIFQDEPGVLKITAGLLPGRNTRKRRMVQLRIPERVAIRVHARLSV
jgi:hypothetical protein